MVLEGYQVRLSKVEEQDLERLRNWRNDPSVNQFMISQDDISTAQQKAWFSKIQRDESQQHFVIHYRETPIGYANLKARGLGCKLNEAQVVEPGLYIAIEKYRNNILAFSPTLLLNDYCFNTLGATKLTAVVHRSNDAALSYNKKLGYKVVKDGEFVEIALTQSDYLTETEQLRSLLSRQPKREH